MIKSMTAFARDQIVSEWGTLQCEIRSVNHRYLELGLRLPELLRDLDPAIRQLCKKQLSRGKVDCVIHFEPHQGHAELSLNADLAKQLLTAEQVLVKHFDISAGLDASTLLRWPGMLEATEVNVDQVQKTCLELVETVLQKFVVARQQEGQQIVHVFLQKIGQVEQYVSQVGGRLPEVQAHYRNRLQQRFDEAKLELDPERLEQEMLLVAHKMDVAEELDRLRAHIHSFKNILNTGDVVGRKLDFLMQEFNREANTLGSKSIDAETTQSAVELKVLIEQLREQVQNIE